MDDARDKRLDEECKAIVKANLDYEKENATLDKFIETQSKKIEELVSKISVSALLKEVDIEEMAQLSNSQ